MNKADLIEALAPRLGGRAAATVAVEAFADVVMREVAAGGSIGISGFGTFERVERAARTGRNPRTGEAVPIDATVSPRFRPGAYFKDVVTDPAKLPKDGLAGARVGSDGAAPARTGAPASVRRSAQPAAPAKRAAKKTTAATGTRKAAVSGTPDTVRATPAASTAEAAPAAAPAPTGRVMSGGEEITAKLLSAKKAELARVKNDAVADKGDKKKGRKDKRSKDGKDDKAGKGKKKDKDKKSKKKG